MTALVRRPWHLGRVKREPPLPFSLRSSARTHAVRLRARSLQARWFGGLSTLDAWAGLGVRLSAYISAAVCLDGREGGFIVETPCYRVDNVNHFACNLGCEILFFRSCFSLRFFLGEAPTCGY